jgi:lactoylglutathione lyase
VRSAGFFSVERINRSSATGAGGSRVAPPGSDITLALVTAGPEVPAVVTGIRLTSADADADHASLRARGADGDDVLRWPGVPPVFKVRDQDGNALEIVELS